MRTAFASLVVVLLSSLAALAQTTGDYFLYQWDGTKFVKVYTTTFPPATHNHSGQALQAASLSLSPTDGTGFLSLPTQYGNTPALPSSGQRVWATNSALKLMDSSGDLVELDFASISGVRKFTFPDPGSIAAEPLVTASSTVTLTGKTISGAANTFSAIPPSAIAQGGATSGQALVWNGLAYAPATITAPVTSVASRTGAITLSTSDISGLGSIATQAANNVTITGGTLSGMTSMSLGATFNTFWLGDANTVLIANTSLAARYTGTERLWVQGGIGFAASYASNLQSYLINRGVNSLGMGLASATPATQYMGGQDATGTNATGGDYVQRPGNGTGSGKSGKWAVETAPPGSSGSTPTTMVRRMEVDEQGVIKLNNATTVPSVAPTGGGYFFSDNGALKWLGSSGTVTTIANP